MAKATVETREITKPVTEDVVVLVLSKDEACVVRDVVGKCSGSMTKSRNKYASSVYGALHDLIEETDASDLDADLCFFDQPE